MKFKLQSNLPHRKNSSVQFPYSGLTTFDETCATEVELKDEDELAALLNAIPDLERLVDHIVSAEDIAANPELINSGIKEGDVVQIPIEPQIEAGDIGKAEDEDNDIGGNTDGDGIPLEGLAGELNALKVAELKQLAEDSGFPKEEWEKLNKQPLIAYLKGKLEAGNATA